MASNSGKPGGDGQPTSIAENKSNSVSAEDDKLDLDKNPIKFGTSEPGVYDMEPHDKTYMEMTLRGGEHSTLVKKILRQKIEQRALDFPRWPGSHGSGVRVMWIESRFWYDRERLSPDFDQDWREYRAKYLHSLNLHPNEPVYVPEYEKFMINPIRRFYMKGGDWLEKNIIQRFVTKERHWSSTFRVCMTRSVLCYFLAVSAYYYVRYNHKKWDVIGGPEIYKSAPVVTPGHPKFPREEIHQVPAHFHDQGFLTRNVFKDLNDWEDTATVL